MKRIPGEAGAGIEAGSWDGPGQLPAGMGESSFYTKTEGSGGREGGQGCPSAGGVVPERGSAEGLERSHQV